MGLLGCMPLGNTRSRAFMVQGSGLSKSEGSEVSDGFYGGMPFGWRAAGSRIWGLGFRVVCASEN